jgi:hypothetical protein
MIQTVTLYQRMNLRALPLLITFLCFAAATTFGKTKTFTILGDQKIEAEVQDGMPLPVEKYGIKVEGAGFMMAEGKLVWGFNFTSQKPIANVRVEDVSGKTAVLLVEDTAPSLKEGMWSGHGSPIAINRKDSPWVFTGGNTTKVFRFTVVIPGNSEPTIIHQPAVYGMQVKGALLLSR